MKAELKNIEIPMSIEEVEEKLSNMHFDNIVKSYYNKVNDIKRLNDEIKKLNEQLRIHDVIKLVCVNCSKPLDCHSKETRLCPDGFAYFVGIKHIDLLKSAIQEIENEMERWHFGRSDDDETLEGINRILVSIGRLSFFNKK